MSILHINQIQNKIVPLFEPFLDLTDIKAGDKEREQKVATRCLAAYAIYSTVECTPQEAAQAVVDGQDDNGIDAIHYVPLTKQMLIVQSKFSKTGSGEPESTDVAKYVKGVRDLFELDLDKFNDGVKKKTPIIQSALNEFDARYSLIFIDTHIANNLSRHSMTHIEDLLAEMNSTGGDTQEESVRFTRLNQSKVYKSLAVSAGNNPIDLEIGLAQWGQLTEPYKAFYGIASGTEIATWWENYDLKLFTRNLRYALGLTEVNEEMERTLKDNPDIFWYYNNGITVICDKATKSAIGGGTREFGAFKLTNAAVVNGAQTVSTIGRYSLSQNPRLQLDDVKVAIRIIQLQEAPEEFGKDVTRTNNRQNRIENRDFVSQDPEQSRIKMELAIDGVDYNITRSEAYISGEKSFDLSEATPALACASGNVRLAVQAKGGVGRFWENLEKGIYKEIFNASVSGQYVYNCVRVIRSIEEVLKQQIDSLPKKKTGRPYGLRVHGNRLIELLVISKLGIKSTLNNVDFKIDTAVIEEITAKVLDSMGPYIEKHYENSFMATLFKNQTKCAEIADHVSSETF